MAAADTKNGPMDEVDHTIESEVEVNGYPMTADPMIVDPVIGDPVIGDPVIIDRAAAEDTRSLPVNRSIVEVVTL